jgi:hypothetical protein
LNDGAGNADGVTRKAVDQNIEKLVASGNTQHTQGEEKNIGVKDEEQTFDSKVLPAPSASAGWLARSKGLQRAMTGRPLACEDAPSFLWLHGVYGRLKNGGFSYNRSIAGLTVFDNRQEARPC